MGIIHGLAVDAAGRDLRRQRAGIAASASTQRRAPSCTRSAPQATGVGQFTGDLRGLALDKETGAIYVVTPGRRRSRSSRCALTGHDAAHARRVWGVGGQGPGQFADGGHRDDRREHDVWVADYGNFRFFRYSPTARCWERIPRRGRIRGRRVRAGPRRRGGSRRDVGPPTPGTSGSSGSRRTAPSWGLRSAQLASAVRMDYPRGIGVNPANGEVWVSSTRDHFIRVHDATGTTYLRRGSGTCADSTASESFPLADGCGVRLC